MKKKTILKNFIRKKRKFKNKRDQKKRLFWKILHARPSILCFYPLEVLKKHKKFKFFKLLRNLMLYIEYNGAEYNPERIGQFF